LQRGCIEEKAMKDALTDRQLSLRKTKEETESLRGKRHDTDHGVSALPRHPTAGLHNAVGNRVVRQMLSPEGVQTKKVSSAEENREPESDAGAERSPWRQAQVAGASGSDEQHDPSRRSRETAVATASEQQNFARWNTLRRIPIDILQQGLGNRATARLLRQNQGGPGTPDLSRKCACGGQSAEVVRETMEPSAEVARDMLGPGGGASEPAASAGSGEPANGAAAQSGGGAGTTSPSGSAGSGLIVEDNAPDVSQGQMKKSDFLGKLKPPVSEAAQAALQGSAWQSAGSVAIEPYFQHYAGQSAQQLETSIKSSVPGAAKVADAGSYIPLVAAQVARAVGAWAKTGAVPPGVPSSLPGVAGTIGSAVSRIAQGAKNAISSIGGMLFKAKEGGARAGDDPRLIQAKLGGGEPLEGSLLGRMSSAFGYDFSGVRVHQGGEAAQLSADLNARAFTIGRNVAFGAGEYQPGNPIGDALIAHELAHVVQQGGASDGFVPKVNNPADHNALERDADGSALRAVLSLWSDGRAALAGIGERSVASLKSGLRLQRCAAPQAQTPVVAPGTQTPSATPQTPVAGPGSGTSTASQIPCGGSDKASTYTPTEQGLNPQADMGGLFGATSKMPASVAFGACKVGESWRFYLTDLTVRIASAVQPENFRTNVNAAGDTAVTRDSFPKIIQDLRPTAEGDDTHHCGGADFAEHITHYSHRRHFWKHQLTVEHEAFHRNDWNSMYRTEIIQAQSQVGQFSLPAASAATPEAAVSQAAQTLRGYFTDAYNRTCQRYAPQQETRAYTAGAPDYQNLVDAIQARATSEGWDKPAQQPGQQQQQPSPQAPPHHP
jgi:hypothetical protein